ncbi:hypothetical protein [Thalassotalea hakodatensis]|uniref:hypothetical protein n=1 Tax=Thalassotalea hakodatensis TaxID=3030492 RepID=UPI0025734DE2|nr:hypothetical protein [Thalassotalea hakodatensis]
MKNLKPFIFSAHADLKPVIPSIKKSHLYEAIAAFCGYKSYAAWQVAIHTKVDDIEQAQGQCFERMLGLGLPAKHALLISQQMPRLWQQYDSITLDDIYAYYSEASYDDALKSTRMLDELKSAVENGSEEAMLLALVVTAQLLIQFDEDPDNRSGEYWYQKKLTNQKLNHFQLQVAEQYQQIMPYRELFQHLLTIFDVSEGPVLHSPSTIEAVCYKHDDGLVRQWSSYFSDRPTDVIDAIIYVLNHHESEQPIIPYYLYLDWLRAEMLLFADREGIVEIIKAAVDDEEKWFWHLIGLRQKVDVTVSTLRAIHADTGEDYDDYGPMDIVGDEGLVLPSVSDDRKAKLQAEVNKITY